MVTSSTKQGTSLFSPKSVAAIAVCVAVSALGCDGTTGADGAELGGGIAGQKVGSVDVNDESGTHGRPEVEGPAREDVEHDPAESPGEGEEREVESPSTPPLADQPIETGPLGGARPAPVTLPDDYDPSTSWPLVMLLHGYSANGFIQDYYLGVSERVNSLGFILIIPEGTVDSSGKQFWNAVPGCCNWDGSSVDDAGYLVGLIEEAKSRYSVDPSRVALIGHSNGGYMSHRLACDRSDLITSIASIAGTSYGDMDTQCAAEHPVSVLQIHGTLDATVSYYLPFAGVGAEETVAWWSARNGCASPVVAPPKAYDTMVWGDETQVTVAGGCESETMVGLWKMDGAGHIPLFSDDFIDDVLDVVLGSPRAAL
jgi:polyhydroxybutyrate depolymerase